MRKGILDESDTCRTQRNHPREQPLSLRDVQEGFPDEVQTENASASSRPQPKKNRMPCLLEKNRSLVVSNPQKYAQERG